MTNTNATTMVADHREWNTVAQELASEQLKLASYDNTLMSTIGNITGKKILDFGAGPGVLALGMQKMGAKVSIWDINEEMRKKSGSKIGNENAYADLNKIPENFFDIIICNLVLCIVPEKEVKIILGNIKNFLGPSGSVYIGFCNPQIYHIAESNLDFRFPSGNAYEDNHEYKKIKKEGGYQIIETHRPIEWYKKTFAEAGLQVSDTFYTPEYELHGRKIKDFIIFKLQREGIIE